MKIAIGIDVHKEKCAAFAVRKDNRKDKTEFLDTFNDRFRRFKSDMEGFAALEEYLGHDHEVHILIENSTKSNRKNDDNDAKELAHYMRRRLNGEDEFQTSFIPNKGQMNRRKLSRFLAEEKNRLAVTKKQVRAYALLNGIHDFDCMTDVSTKSAINKLAALDSKDPLPKLMAQSISDSKKLISFTEKTIRQEYYSDRMFDILFSIPGFGVHTAAYIAAEIVDIGRFSTPEGFSSYFGVRPSQKDSADSQKNRHISHRGDTLARRLIYQATFVHIFCCPDSHISKKYRRLIARGKHHRVAVVACANSMLMMVYSLLTENRTYKCDPQSLAKARAEVEKMEVDYEEDEVPDLPGRPAA